jgi:uncharacterized protein DUF4382
VKIIQRVGVYGFAGLALAVGVILFGTAFGVIRTASPGLNPGSPAALSIALTDPPSVPNGVTKVYITYSDIGVHVSGLGDSGWLDAGASGTIETLGLVNVSQTISFGSFPSGTYDLLRFNISSAAVDFEGTNYSATVRSGELSVPIIGGLELNSSTSAAALIDIQPVVLNLGNGSRSTFALAAGATALQIPSAEVTPAVAHLGYKFSLSQRSWFNSFTERNQGVVTVNEAVLTLDSFSLTLTNPTSFSTSVRMIILTPESQGVHPSSYAGSFLFAVEPDRTLVQIVCSGSTCIGEAMSTLAQSAFSGQGYELSAGSSVTFSYSGTINSLFMQPGGGEGISAGSNYTMTIIGDHTLSVSIVTAS